MHEPAQSLPVVGVNCAYMNEVDPFFADFSERDHMRTMIVPRALHQVLLACGAHGSDGRWRFARGITNRDA